MDSNQKVIQGFCSRCGNRIEKEQRFCSVCGFDLENNIPKNEVPPMIKETESTSDQKIQEHSETVEYKLPEYIQPAYSAPAADMAEPKKKNPLIAKVAFILSLVSIIPFLNFITLLPAIIMSVMVLIKHKGKKIGMALAALIISVCIILLTAGIVILGFADDDSIDYYFSDYEDIADEPWAKVSNDKIVIDTDPYDAMENNNEDALFYIDDINNSFKFPDDLYDRMIETSPLDGIQSEVSKDKKYMATWSYDPETGLVVTYTENNDML